MRYLDAVEDIEMDMEMGQNETEEDDLLWGQLKGNSPKKQKMSSIIFFEWSFCCTYFNICTINISMVPR